MVENGKIAAVVVNNISKITLKRLHYYQEMATLILRAGNPAFKDMLFQNEELNEVYILGKTVSLSDVK